MNITGQLVRKFPSKTRDTKFGMKKVTDFVLRCGDKEVKCTFWGELPADAALGSNLSFEGSAREYNGETSYTVSKAGVQVGASTGGGVAVEEAPAQVSQPVGSAPRKDREEYRADAEAAVKLNLESAKKISEELALGKTVNLIDLGDMVGRTLTAISIGR